MPGSLPICRIRKSNKSKGKPKTLSTRLVHSTTLRLTLGTSMYSTGLLCMSTQTRTYHQISQGSVKIWTCKWMRYHGTSKCAIDMGMQCHSLIELILTLFKGHYSKTGSTSSRRLGHADLNHGTDAHSFTAYFQQRGNFVLASTGNTLQRFLCF